MNQSFGDSLDRDYTREQLLEMRILGFAELIERLTRADYDGTALTEEQLETVTHMMECGAYDTEAEGVHPHSPCSRGRLPLVSRRAPAVFLV